MATANTGYLSSHQQSFVRLVQENARHHRVHEVFTDFCEVAAISISNAVDRQHFAVREARYLAIVARYSRDEVERFAQMLGCIVLALEEGFHDCLGGLFMALELGEHFKGQFFTPYEVARFMARMLFNASAMPEPFLTLSEPACGAGAMVIAFAETMRDAKINYQQCLHVTAQDIDATAVHMAYVQLSLLHIPAVVIRGNTLTVSCDEYFVTPAHVLGGWDWRLSTRARGSSSTPSALPVIDEAAVNVEVGIDEQCARIVEDRIEQADQLDLF